MEQETQKSYLGLQNLGWIDRMIRFTIAVAMVAAGLSYMYLVAPVWADTYSIANWPYWIILVALYPLLSAMTGMDPVYRLFGARTCGTSSRNPCGTLPYELEAAAGLKPIPRDNVDHSVLNTRGHESLHPVK